MNITLRERPRLPITFIFLYSRPQQYLYSLVLFYLQHSPNANLSHGLVELVLSLLHCLKASPLVLALHGQITSVGPLTFYPASWSGDCGSLKDSASARPAGRGRCLYFIKLLLGCLPILQNHKSFLFEYPAFFASHPSTFLILRRFSLLAHCHVSNIFGDFIVLYTISPISFTLSTVLHSPD